MKNKEIIIKMSFYHNDYDFTLKKIHYVPKSHGGILSIGTTYLGSILFYS